jgi:ribosome maturation factor RimP
MRNKNADIDKIMALAAEVASEDGLEVYDVRVETEGPRVSIRVFLDKPAGGVQLGEIESFSRRFGARLDVEDPVEGPFVLEASSPGVNRPLTRPGHYAAAIGKRVRVTLVEPIDGVRNAVGILEIADAETIVIRREAGPLSIPMRLVRKANLEATQEELFGKGKKKK